MGQAGQPGTSSSSRHWGEQRGYEVELAGWRDFCNPDSWRAVRPRVGQMGQLVFDLQQPKWDPRDNQKQKGPDQW